MHRRLGSIGLLALLTGCNVALDIPAQAMIHCASDSECPASLKCAIAVGRCVAPGVNAQPPAVVDGSLDIPDALIATGEDVVVRFRVTEALAQPPAVHLSWAAGLAPDLDLGAPESFDADSWSYGFRVRPPASTPEAPAALVIALLDTNGLTGGLQVPAALSFDFHAPTVPSFNVIYASLAPAPIAALSAMGEQGTATVTFYTDKLIAGTPAVTVECGPTSATLARQSGEASASFFTYHLDSPAGLDDGSCDLAVGLQDVAGNTAELTLTGAVDVDRVAPDATGIDNAWLRHLRIPQGASRTRTDLHPDGRVAQFLVPVTLDEQVGLPLADPLFDCHTALAAQCLPTAHVVDSTPGAPLVEMRVYDGDGSLLATVPRTDAGYSAARLALPDSPSIYVTLVDGAGNESPTPARVQQVEWVATLANKTLGTPRPNPHVALVDKRFGGVLQSSSASEIVADGLRAPDSERVAAAAAGAWRARAVSVLPIQGTTAYDPGLGRVIFGDGTTLRTWNLAAAATPLTTADPEGDGDVSARDLQAMVFDSRRGQLLAIAGGQTWAYTGVSWQRIFDAVAGVVPPNLIGAAAVYDSARARVVLFGGEASNAVAGTTYEWDGSAWTACAASAAGCSLADPEGDGEPTPRRDASFVYDPVRNVSWLFGGIDQSLAALADLWRWDGHSWARCDAASTACPANGGPPPARYAAGAVYDPVRDRLVLVGGSYLDAGGNILDRADLWEWDGVTWTAPPLHGDLPGVRAGMGAAWVPSLGGVLFFGGSPDSVAVGGTAAGRGAWRWDGVTFRQLSPAGTNKDTGAYQRDGAPAIYSAVERRLVAEGGFTPPDFSTCDGADGPCADTWAFDQDGWHVAQATSPLARDGASLTYATTTEQPLLFGGEDAAGDMQGDTWTWQSGDWSVVATTDVLGDGDPSARLAGCLAYDPLRRRAVLFGGLAAGKCDGGATSYCSTTWEFDGTEWARCSSTNTAGCILTDVEGDGEPSGRTGAAMAYDPSRGEVVLHGGFNFLGGKGRYLADTWSFNGSRWLLVDNGTGSPVSTRAGHSLLFDSVGGHLLLAGGVGTGSTGGIGQAVPRAPDVYALGAGSWTALMLPNNPALPVSVGASWQPFAAVGLLLSPPTSFEPTTFVYDSPATGQAAIIASFTFADAQGPSPLTCGATSCNIDAVRFRFDATGTSGAMTIPLHQYEQAGLTSLTRVYDDATPPAGDLTLLGGLDAGDVVTLVILAPAAAGTGTVSAYCMQPLLPAGAEVCAAAATPLSASGLTEIPVTWSGPGHVYRFGLRLGLTALDLGNLRIEARKEGRPGALLEVWQDGRYTPVASHDATDVAELVYVATSPSGIGRLFVGEALNLNAAVVARGPDGQGGTGVHADYVEVSVRYHRP